MLIFHSVVYRLESTFSFHFGKETKKEFKSKQLHFGFFQAFMKPVIKKAPYAKRKNRDTIKTTSENPKDTKPADVKWGLLSKIHKKDRSVRLP